MANELQIKWIETGITAYALIYNAAGEVFNGTAFEAYTDANIGGYDVVVEEEGTASRLYIGDMPANAASAAYSISYHKQAGGSPAVSDLLIGTEIYRPSAAAVTTIQNGLATSTAQTTAQNDLDILTGTDGATLATSQPNYAPSKAGDQMALVNDAITSAKFDESTAFPITAANGSQFTAIPWNAAWDAEVESEVLDALQTTVPDSVPADGSRPNMQQAAYILVQALTEFSISGTTLTIKKPDGSTTLLTLTLSDATDPTGVTRAS